MIVGFLEIKFALWMHVYANFEKIIIENNVGKMRML
jgi:hypothetical protein